MSNKQHKVNKKLSHKRGFVYIEGENPKTALESDDEYGSPACR